MSSSPVPATSGRGFPWRSTGSLLVLVLAGVLMFVLTPQADKPDDIVKPTDQAVSQQTIAEKELANVLVGMQAGRLDAVQDRFSATDELNHWQDLIPPDPAKPLTADTESLAQVLPKAILEQVQSTRFLPADTAHLRMSLLARETVDAISRKHPQGSLTAEEHEAEVLGALFQFVVDHVVDMPIKEPQTPYETLLFGRGQTRDRIWCFAELVRQLGADCLLMTPSPLTEQPQVILGVLSAEGRLWMFEPNLGVPFHDPQQSPGKLLPLRPVTFDQLLSNAAVLGAFNLDSIPRLQLPGTKYPLTADQLKTVAIQLVGTPAQWSPRMAYLEFRTPTEVTASFYQGLGSNRLRETGALDRIRAADAASTAWEAKEIGLWQEPLVLEQQFEEQVRTNQNSEYALLRLVSSGPQVLNPATQVIESARTTLEDVRVEQLSGQFASALSHLLPIRNADQKLNSAENRLTADFGFYRTYECQMQLQQRDSAKQTLTSYLKGSTPNHLWTGAAIHNLARLHAEDIFLAPAEQVRDLPDPFGLLQKLPLTNRNIWVMQRWYRIFLEQGKIPPEETPAPVEAAVPPQSSQPPSPALPEKLD